MLPHCLFFVVAAVILSAALSPVSSARSDLVALYGLRASLDVRAQDWPRNSDPCAWTGVTCSAGRVVALRLAGLRRTHRGKLRASFAVDALQDLTALKEFDASGFPLPGRIPAWFGRGLPPSLAVVDLRSAAIDGTLPADIGMSGNLKSLVLAGNSLSGRIPASLLAAKGLKFLDLSNNNLTGVLPSISSHVGDGIMDGLFNVSGNSLYGALGNSLGSLKKRFRVVDVSSNYFDSVVGVGAANGSDGTVDVKMNCLSDVPNQRSRSDCEVFYNRVVKVPAPSSPSPQPPKALPSPGKRREKWKYVLAGVLAAAAILVVLVLVALVFCLMRIGRRPGGRGLEQNEEGMRSGRRRDSSVNPVIWPPMSVSLTANAAAKGPASFMDEFTYEQLLHATAGFGDDNLVKHGHAGDIYRGVLESGFHVVVKKIDVKSSKKDMSEFGFLAKKFHGRIVPLLGHLTKDEEELLVYKYMPKGDLTTALHKKLVDTEEGLPSLDWITRLKIAIGVAEALCFLHDECSPPLVHRDIQASSVLLDDKFEVRLGSLSEICTQQSVGNQNILSRMLRSSKSLDKNTSGRPASSSYDVYCFGKVLLELITGDFGVSGSNDEVSEQWLANKLGHISVCDKESISNIVDPSLIVDDDHLEEVWAVSIVAKACLNSKPSRRPLARYILMALESPLRVVREDFRSNSARLRSTSSRSSWHSAFHGSSYRSSEIMPMSGKILVRKHSAKSQGSSGGENSFSFKRASREIVPEPLELEDYAIVLDHPTH